MAKVVRFPKAGRFFGYGFDIARDVVVSFKRNKKGYELDKRHSYGIHGGWARHDYLRNLATTMDKYQNIDRDPAPLAEATPAAGTRPFVVTSTATSKAHYQSGGNVEDAVEVFTDDNNIHRDTIRVTFLDGVASYKYVHRVETSLELV